MIIALGFRPYHVYNRHVMTGILGFAHDHREIRLWAPSCFEAGSTPKTIDGIIGANRPVKLADSNVTVHQVNIHSHHVEGVVQVCPDNNAIAVLATDHFRGLKLPNMAMLYSEGFRLCQVRFNAFRSACDQYGYTPHRLFLPAQASMDNDVFHAQLRDLPKPVGVLLPSDSRGHEFIETCMAMGFDVPGDIAVLGIDNFVKECVRKQPKLSSIDIAPESIGYRAMEILIALIEGRDVPPVTLIPPSGVVARESSNHVTPHSQPVSEALEFMSAHLEERIEVEDLLRVLGISRRAFETRFKSEVGESPATHMQTMRLRKARHLLANTRLQVDRIAMLCGIGSISYLCKLFKRRFGMTPLQYRASVPSVFPPEAG